MKCLLVALLVFVLVSQGECRVRYLHKSPFSCAHLKLFLLGLGEALQCYCGGKRNCPSGSVEQCTLSSDACASVIFEVGSSEYFVPVLSNSLHVGRMMLMNFLGHLYMLY